MSARSPSESGASRDEHLVAKRHEHMHRDAVRAEALGDLLLIRHGGGDEDLDRTSLGRAPAVGAFEGRAPQKDATEDAILCVDGEVVIPGAELAACVDPAVAALGRCV